MTGKTAGYLISAIGLIGLLASSFEQVKQNLSFLKGIPDTQLTIISLVILAVGIFIIAKTGTGKTKGEKEVPIYKGKEVVGFRRVK